MSPDVLRLPVISRSEDSTDGAGFDFGGADALKSEPAGLAASVPLGVSVSDALGPGSLILDLENILSSSYISHGVDGVAVHTDLVVKVGPGRATRIPHSTNSLAARDPLTDADIHGVEMCITCFDAKVMADLDQTPIARRP